VLKQRDKLLVESNLRVSCRTPVAGGGTPQNSGFKRPFLAQRGDEDARGHGTQSQVGVIRPFGQALGGERALSEWQLPVRGLGLQSRAQPSPGRPLSRRRPLRLQPGQFLVRLP
jgi:hypothetical protein